MVAAPALVFSLYRKAGEFVLDATGVAAAGTTALFGPSGSGKTMALNCIAGMETPDRGEVVLNGRVLFSTARRVNVPAEKRRIGYVFQDGALFPHMTVQQNIRYGLDRTPEAERRVDVDGLVRLLEIGPLLNRRPAGMSGGEKQRVALARALATSPELLLLDEPLASLDAGLRGAVIGYLKKVQREFGVPVVLVSHSISEVVALAQFALVMREGKVVVSGRPFKVLLERAAGFRHETGGLENILDGEVVEAAGPGGAGKVRVGRETLYAPVGELTAGSKVSVAIGASEVIIASGRPSGLSARNIVPARVTELEVRGGMAVAEVEIGERLIVELTESSVGDLGLRMGSEVYLVFKSTSVGVRAAVGP